jgi:hypothetical protein
MGVLWCGGRWLDPRWPRQGVGSTTLSCAPPVRFVRAVELCLADLSLGSGPRECGCGELLRAPLGPWCAAAAPCFRLRAVGRYEDTTCQDRRKRGRSGPCFNIRYSLRPQKNNDLGFKICPKKNDVLLNLACVHVHVGMQQSITT